MKLLSIEYVPGKEIEALGMVKGTVVQTKNIGRDFMAGIKFCSLHPAPCRSVVRKIRIIAGFLKLFIIRPVSYLTVRFTRKVV